MSGLVAVSQSVTVSVCTGEAVLSFSLAAGEASASSVESKLAWTCVCVCVCVCVKVCSEFTLCMTNYMYIRHSIFCA